MHPISAIVFLKFEVDNTIYRISGSVVKLSYCNYVTNVLPRAFLIIAT